MHWSRWGDPTHAADLPSSAASLLELAFGALRATHAVAEESVALPDAGLPDDFVERCRSAVGAEHVDLTAEARLRHTGGKSTVDLLRLRSGDAEGAPDAVLRPADHDQVVQLLQLASHSGVAVTPYGGGTSVVGGLRADPPGSAGTVALDLSRLDALVEVDAVSLTATLQAGVSGPRAEELLARHGLTLGHYPQSFEYASIGGFAATRSSGQASSGYGRFDQMVLGLTLATGHGTWTLGRAPMNAAGPDLRQLVLGSEGAFGVITSVRVAVRRVPEARHYETWLFPSFAAGTRAMRELVQDGLAPTVLRLSDETETVLNLGDPGNLGAGPSTGCRMTCGYEGRAERVARMRSEVGAALSGLGGSPQGAEEGSGWERGRFSAPYLRDTLLDNGILVETLETAAFWNELAATYDAVRAALTSALSDANPLVLCHISHVYPAGASLYFTVAARADADPLAQWAEAKQAASTAMMAAGATITHHHAIGRDHRPWLQEEIGDVGVQVLRAVKECLDPGHVLNPGVLIP